jgi:hypothetical protein
MRAPRALASAMILASAVFLSACQPGSAGPLAPVAGSGVKVEAGPVALLVDGTIEARVSGRWSSTTVNELRIRYRNGGTTPLRIALTGIQMQHALGKAALITAVDVTGVDMTDKREDNDQGKMLFSVDAAEGGGGTGAVLDVPAGATREISCEFTSFARAGAVARGDTVVSTIPFATRSAKATFTAASPQWWVFW